MRVLFLNQYFPPDPAPTGVLMMELAEDLRQRGIEACFASAAGEYRNAQEKGGSRIFRETAALLRILWRGLRAPRPDLIVSGSSPPCLVAIAHIVSMARRAPHVHWAMDLYPDIAVVLGEIPPGVLASAIGRLLGVCYRNAARVVALDTDMVTLLARHRVKSEIVAPWISLAAGKRVSEILASGAPTADAPWTWIYSGNLGRAHEWRTLIEAQKLIEDRDGGVRLRFQGGGPSWSAAQACAASLGLKRCDWRPYVAEAALPESLLRCQVTVATQLSSTQGLLWPSKLSLLMSLPRPILWVGPDSGAIASLLRERPNSGIFRPGDAAGVADWILRQIRHPSVEARGEDPLQIRRDALAKWAGLIRSAG